MPSYTTMFLFESFVFFLIKDIGVGPRGVIIKAIDWGIVISKFELHSRYYVHFRKNTIGKGMNPLILPAMG